MTKLNEVQVTVSGPVGSGKSAVMGEIEIALKAIGLTVKTDADFQTEKNMTHADWQSTLDMYQPVVTLTEVYGRPEWRIKDFADGWFWTDDPAQVEKAISVGAKVIPLIAGRNALKEAE